MAKTKKSTRLFLYIVLGLMALLTLVGLFIPKTVYPPYTTHSPKADGTKAIYLLLNNEGIQASQLVTAVQKGQGLMIVVEPEKNLVKKDWEQVLDWVARGNTLFLASSTPNYIYQHFGYKLIKTSKHSSTHNVSSSDSLLKDVQELNISGQARLKKHKSMTFAYGDEKGIFLAKELRGKGQIVLLTLPDLLTNKEIAKKDNLILILNIVRHYGQENVWFNELAHGYTWATKARDVFTWPLRLVVFQLGLGILLLYYYWGKRFGRPVPLPEDLSQVSGEYVSSLANIYRQGRARQLTLESIFKGFKDELAHYLGVSIKVPSKELVSILSSRPAVDTKQLEELLRRGEELLAMPDISETDLFTVARDLEKWRKNNLSSSLERRKNLAR